MSVGNAPLISIGIPTFNRAALLRRAIESALNQSYERIEIIISDNASTDATEQLCLSYAARYANVTYLKQTSNVGATANFVEVLTRASGAFFMWLGDDDWIDPNYVASAIAAFRDDDSLALVSGKAKYYRSGQPAADGNLFCVTGESWWARVLAYYWRVGDNGVFYGLMKTSFVARSRIRNVMGGDWLLMARLAAFGKIRMLEHTFVHRELGGATSSYRHIARALNLPSIHGTFPFASVAASARADILSDDEPFRVYPIGQRRLLGLAVVATLLLKRLFMFAMLPARIVSRVSLRRRHCRNGR